MPGYIGAGECARQVAGLWTADEDIDVNFNNDPFACALIDAYSFAEGARRTGLHPTRAVDWWEVRVRNLSPGPSPSAMERDASSSLLRQYQGFPPPCYTRRGARVEGFPMA